MFKKSCSCLRRQRWYVQLCTLVTVAFLLYRATMFARCLSAGYVGPHFRDFERLNEQSLVQPNSKPPPAAAELVNKPEADPVALHSTHTRVVKALNYTSMSVVPPVAAYNHDCVLCCVRKEHLQLCLFEG